MIRKEVVVGKQVFDLGIAGMGEAVSNRDGKLRTVELEVGTTVFQAGYIENERQEHQLDTPRVPDAAPALRQDCNRFHLRQRGSMSRLTDDQKLMREMVNVYTTPIVYHPGGWEDTVPEWLKGRVIAERMEMVCDGGWEKATDAEITCYLMTASLVQPLGEDWTNITIWEAKKQLPQLGEALASGSDGRVHYGEKLTSDQERELEDLKHKIRNSQLRRQSTKKKGGTMPQRRLVLMEKDNTVLVGVSREDTDPFTINVEGDLETAVASIPRLLKEAEAKWTDTPKNPEYKPPAPAPKPEAKKAPTGGAKPATEPAPATAPASTPDLPLLANQKPAAPAPAEQADQPTPPAEKTEERHLQPSPEPTQEQAAAAPDIDKQTEEIMAIEHELGRDEPKPAENGTEDTESGKKPAESGTTDPMEVEGMNPATEDHTPMAEASRAMIEEEKNTAPVEAEPPAPATTTPEPAPVAAPTAAPPAAPPLTGEVEYWLKDGRGPFATVQAALDGLGIDKENRPKHNRWDRLSTAFKDAIQRKPKAS
jgi:hypothetical protein